MGDAPNMISWGAVRTIAVALASRTEKASDGDFDYERAVERAVDPLSRFTGIELPQGPPSGRQLRGQQGEWIDFNIDGFGALMEPVLKRAAAGSDNLTGPSGARRSRRRSGFSSDSSRPGSSGSTIRGRCSRERGRRARQGVLSRWEHSRGGGQDRGARGRSQALDRAARDDPRLAVRGLSLAARSPRRAPGEADLPLADRLGVRETIRRLSENMRTGGRSVELMMNRSQRESFDQMQATMSVIEATRTTSMHSVGRSLVPQYEHLKNRMARSRAHRPPFETAVFRITGLDVKLEQYRLGSASPKPSPEERAWRA